ncbi:DUF2975 domain-containing protein [Roseibium sp. M-1]
MQGQLPEGKQERGQRLVRIRRLAGFLKWTVSLALLFIFFSGLLLVTALVIPGTMDAVDVVVDFGPAERAIGGIPLLQRLGLALLTGIAFLLLSGAFWHARQIFAHFQKTDFFSQNAPSTVCMFGIWLIAFGLLDTFNDPICAYLSTLDLGEGRRVIEWDFGGGEIFFMILGALMLLFGWILREASQIVEENRQFI